MITKLLCLLVGVVVCGKAHDCQVPINPNAILSPSLEDKPYPRINPAKFRIERVYTDSFRRLPDYHRVVNELIEPVMQKFESVFKTRVPKTKKHYIYHGCTNNHYSFKNDEYGEPQHYCVKECADTTLCYDTPVPRHVVGECRSYKNETLRTVLSSGPGADADFIMVITSDRTSLCSGNLLAYAISCQTEIGTDRPEAGMMNLCPHSIKLNKAALESSRGTVMHEALHAMGFSAAHFAYFRTTEGKAITPRDPRSGYTNLGSANGYPIASEKIQKTVQRRWLSKAVDIQRTVNVLVTPTLLKVARQHYGCPTLDGVEMEAQGGTSTAYSHFEKRTLMNELMTGSTSTNPVFSLFTLAFFQDSGWYDVDFNQSAPLKWGKGLGCDFVYQSCYEYMYRKHKRRQSTFPWCDRMKYTYRIAQYGNYYGRCMLRYSGNTINPEFYNVNRLDNVPRNEWRLYAGDEELADYCPYIKEMNKES